MTEVIKKQIRNGSSLATSSRKSGRSSSLCIHTPKEHSTSVVVEEIDPEALFQRGKPPHITYPPSPTSKVSPQTQEAYTPSETGQNPFSHPAPLGSAVNTPDLEGPQFALVSTTRQECLLLSDTSRDVREQNGGSSETASYAGASTSYHPQRGDPPYSAIVPGHAFDEHFGITELLNDGGNT